MKLTYKSTVNLLVLSENTLKLREKHSQK